jgi:hypothetical protein
MTNWLKLGNCFKITNRMYTTNVRYTNLSPKGSMDKLSNKKRADCLATVVKVLVVLWKSGVCCFGIAKNRACLSSSRMKKRSPSDLIFASTTGRSVAVANFNIFLSARMARRASRQHCFLSRVWTEVAALSRI